MEKKPKPKAPECSICHEIFRDPKVLPCGHSFCLQCLLKLAPHGTKSIKCPLCQRDIQIPNGDVNGLTTNFELRNAVEHIDPEDQSDGQEEPPHNGKKPEESKLLRNLAIGAGTAVVGVAAAASIPFLILPAIGFGAGGIAAGSAAAGMMSAAASASGGAVATGSFVAGAQSIGAAGLAAGTYAAAGAAAGAAGFAGAEAATRLKKDNNSDNSNGNQESNDGTDDDNRGNRDGNDVVDGVEAVDARQPGADDARQPGANNVDEGTEVGPPQNRPNDEDDDVTLSKLRQQDPPSGK